MVKQGKIDPDVLINLSPDSFETYSETLYFKPASSRQSIELPGGYSTDIRDEYEAMTDLYNVMTDIVVEPYALTKNPEGYVMEYVDGSDLNEVLNSDHSGYDFESVLEDVHRFGERLKSEKIPHGDIRCDNFIVENSDTLRVVDAAGIPEDIEAPGIGTMRGQAVTWDITDINERIIDRIVADTDVDVDPGDYYVEHPVQTISSLDDAERARNF